MPGGAGGIAHFYAVSSYVLQHPVSMGYRIESLAWLRRAVASALSGEADVAELRRAARSAGKAGGRVRRREGERVQDWGVHAWRVRVTDMLAGGVDGYGEHVGAWARATLEDIGAAERA